MTSTDSTPTPPPGPGAPGADPQVLALARAADRTEKKIGALDTHVRQLAADVARVVSVVADSHRLGPDIVAPATGAGDGADGGQEPPAVRSWLLGADPDQAATDLSDLIEWLDRVYLRYHDAALTPCWLWHPHVIEELWWLRRAHSDAYDPKDGSWVRVGDWHDRQRPAVSKRVREAIGKCDLALHAPDREHGRAPAVAPMAAHAAQIAHAWTTGGTRPAPNAGQFDEATAYLRELHRSHR